MAGRGGAHRPASAPRDRQKPCAGTAGCRAKAARAAAGSRAATGCSTGTNSRSATGSRARTGSSSPAGACVSPAPEPAKAPAPAPPPAPPTPAPIARTEAVRFLTDRRTVVGLAYDVVSRRFLFGDRVARKLIVVSEGSNEPLDLVRAESAGFRDIAAVGIDERRGDLWVVSSADADGTGTLHRLQLVSGRPLKSFHIAPESAPADPVDVAITHGGTVLVLDARGRVLLLRPGAPSLETVMHLDVPGPASLAVGTDEITAYVAHGTASRASICAGDPHRP